MKTMLLTKKAEEAFRGKNFLKALCLYKKLSILLGERLFAFNINKCVCNILQQNANGHDFISRLKVACIMDPFSFGTFSPESNFMRLYPHDSVNQLEEFQPDLLFVESAWHGKDNEWNLKISNFSKELSYVLNWCNENNVPTVFWNKEDPVHFKTFIKSAKHFDYIFTTDIDSIIKYKKELKHERVFLLPFCFQHRQHNPTEKYVREDKICFAGSYYHKYAERCQVMDDYMKHLPKVRDVTIYDRNYHKNHAAYKFPEKYKKYILGTLPYAEIDKAYKGYNYALNMNTVRNSCSMFSRRIFELFASNTTPISNYSYGIRFLFGDLLLCSESGSRLAHLLQTTDEDTLLKMRLQALRKSMLEHTATERMKHIIDKVFSIKLTNMLPSVLCIAKVQTLSELKWVLHAYTTQKYEYKSLLLVCENFFFATQKNIIETQCHAYENINIIAFDTFVNYHFISEWIAPLSANHYYGTNYLLDLILATKYTDAQAIGKLHVFAVERGDIISATVKAPYTFVKSLPVSSSIFSKNLLKSMLSPQSLFSTAAIHAHKEVFFTTDAYNFCEHAGDFKDIKQIPTIVDDIPMDAGSHIHELFTIADSISMNNRVGQTYLDTLQCQATENIYFEHTYIPRHKAPLVLTSRYPSYNDLYSYMFLHTRLLAYKQMGHPANVFKLIDEDDITYDEFEGIDVVSGNEKLLRATLESGRVDTVFVHVLKPNMWNVLKDFPHIHIVVWVHGSEIQPWYRRAYNFTTSDEIERQKKLSAARMRFWQSVMNPMPSNVHLVFISQFFADEVMEDYNVPLIPSQYTVIHNPINTQLFSYIPKSSEQRKKILSIRPYISAKYANDLSVKTVLALAKTPIFNELEFKFIGDGSLFDETLKPLKHFSNVICEKKFLTPLEMAELHKEYGVFLTPTRWDSQGVSRDEAMSSGLVPISNAITAVLEFVDENSGILVPAEDWQGMADAVIHLYDNPEEFLRLSQGAATRVRIQSSFEHTVRKELAL